MFAIVTPLLLDILTEMTTMVTPVSGYQARNILSFNVHRHSAVSIESAAHNECADFPGSGLPVRE
jgi:hypothetical protein